MMPHDPPRLCETCYPPHIENCPDCFGWGLHSNGVPISARSLDTIDHPGQWERCPTCNGTPFGIAALTE